MRSAPTIKRARSDKHIVQLKKIKESFPMVLINSIIGKLLLVFAYLILKEIGVIICNGVYAIVYIYAIFGELLYPLFIFINFL